MAGRHTIYLRMGSLIVAGASVNVSSYTSSPHVGTHADAPLHVREGWPGSHELPLDAFYGPAIVVDVSNLTKEIEMEELEKINLSLSWSVFSCARAVRSRAARSPRTGRRLSENCVRTLLGQSSGNAPLAIVRPVRRRRRSRREERVGPSPAPPSRFPW